MVKYSCQRPPSLGSPTRRLSPALARPSHEREVPSLKPTPNKCVDGGSRIFPGEYYPLNHLTLIFGRLLDRSGIPLIALGCALFPSQGRHKPNLPPIPTLDFRAANMYGARVRRGFGGGAGRGS